MEGAEEFENEPGGELKNEEFKMETSLSFYGKNKSPAAHIAS
jgi:hypothetical protein